MCRASKGKPVIVTCNDMLAVRGALGELPDLKASFFGRFLQRWICRGLQNASVVACVSQFTFDDLRRILSGRRNPYLVLNGLNYPYRQISAGRPTRLTALSEIDRPFILHVGEPQAQESRWRTPGFLRGHAGIQILSLFSQARLLSREHLLLRIRCKSATASFSSPTRM